MSNVKDVRKFINTSYQENILTLGSKDNNTCTFKSFEQAVNYVNQAGHHECTIYLVDDIMIDTDTYIFSDKRIIFDVKFHNIYFAQNESKLFIQSNVTFKNTIFSLANGAGEDKIVITGDNVIIEDCSVEVGSSNILISGKNNIKFINCKFNTMNPIEYRDSLTYYNPESVLKFESETAGTFSNIQIKNCEFNYDNEIYDEISSFYKKNRATFINFILHNSVNVKNLEITNCSFITKSFSGSELLDFNSAISIFAKQTNTDVNTSSTVDNLVLKDNKFSSHQLIYISCESSYKNSTNQLTCDNTFIENNIGGSLGFYFQGINLNISNNKFLYIVTMSGMNNNVMRYIDCVSSVRPNIGGGFFTFYPDLFRSCTNININNNLLGLLNIGYDDETFSNTYITVSQNNIGFDELNDVVIKALGTFNYITAIQSSQFESQHVHLNLIGNVVRDYCNTTKGALNVSARASIKDNKFLCQVGNVPKNIIMIFSNYSVISGNSFLKFGNMNSNIYLAPTYSITNTNTMPQTIIDSFLSIAADSYNCIENNCFSDSYNDNEKSDSSLIKEYIPAVSSIRDNNLYYLYNKQNKNMIYKDVVRVGNLNVTMPFEITTSTKNISLYNVIRNQAKILNVKVMYYAIPKDQGIDPATWINTTITQLLYYNIGSEVSRAQHQIVQQNFVVHSQIGNDNYHYLLSPDISVNHFTNTSLKDYSLSFILNPALTDFEIYLDYIEITYTY